MVCVGVYFCCVVGVVVCIYFVDGGLCGVGGEVGGDFWWWGVGV